MAEHSTPGDPVAGMLAALAHIDGAGFHGIDEALRKESPVIDEFWSSRARAAQIAAPSIPWPEALEEQEKSFGAAAGQLATTLSVGDVKTSAAAAKEAHRAWHGLNTPAWNYLGETAGITMGGGAHQHHHQH